MLAVQSVDESQAIYVTGFLVTEAEQLVEELHKISVG